MLLSTINEMYPTFLRCHFWKKYKIATPITVKMIISPIIKNTSSAGEPFEEEDALAVAVGSIVVPKKKKKEQK